jgi:hypothetical protein
MFRDPIRSTPLLADLSDVNLRLKITRADDKLFGSMESRLPGFRVW